MGGNALFGPLAAAFAWGRRPPALLVLLVLIARVAGLRAFQSQAYANATREDFVWITLVGTVVPALVDAGLIYVLARTLLARESDRSPPFVLRALGLYLLVCALTFMIGMVSGLVMASGDWPPFVMTYAASLGLPLGVILAFPILVRAFAAAAGIAEPTLGPMWAFAFGRGRFGYLWFAILAILFHVLPAIVFTSLLPAGTGTTELADNLLVSAITGTGAWLRFLLAIVVAQMATRTMSPTAEVFA